MNYYENIYCRSNRSIRKRVIQDLISSNHEVVGLSRSNKNDQIITQLDAEPRRGNLFDRNSLVSVSSDCDVILHLATAIPANTKGTPLIGN